MAVSINNFGMTDYAQKVFNSFDAPLQIEGLMIALNEEKHRRRDFREWLSPNVKAEFINGEVVVHSPVRSQHWEITDLFSSLLSLFVRLNKLGRIGTEKVMIGLMRNDYEPDLVFFKKEKSDLFTDDQVIFPAPDFVVEILSKSTASRDRGIKMLDYATNGIQEYWIVNPARKQIEQYILFSPNDRKYSPAKVYHIGQDIESRVIRGFVIPVAAIFDAAENLAAVKSFVEK